MEITKIVGNIEIDGGPKKPFVAEYWTFENVENPKVVDVELTANKAPELPPFAANGLAGFDFEAIIEFFIEYPLADPAHYVKQYGVEVARTTAPVAARVIGVYHLSPEQNNNRHNIFVDIVDANGKPLRGGRIVYSWEGMREDEVPPLLVLDKPLTEPGGSIALYPGQRTAVRVDSLSDVVRNLHADHAPEGEGNQLHHHSFYVVFQTG